MAIVSHALTTVAELKEELSVSGSGRDSMLEEIANRTTGVIEAHLDREVMNRMSGTVASTVTEYYSILEYTPELWLNQWPVASITGVYELSAWPTTYGSTLTANVNYFLDDDRGMLLRIDTGGEISWPTGRRAVKVVYAPGYTALSSVPYPIRDVARKYAALLYTEIDRKQFGVSAYSDAIGNTTRFWNAKLTDDMLYQLAPYRRQYGFAQVLRCERA
jgi:hypothetical protein